MATPSHNTQSGLPKPIPSKGDIILAVPTLICYKYGKPKRV